MADKFEFHYKSLSQEEKQEIESIKRQYLSNNDISDIDKLKSLDRKVRVVPRIISYVIGVCGTLVFGLGLTFVLEWNQMLIGIFIMVIGSIFALLAYPCYKVLNSFYKKKYGDEIISLSDKILQEN